MTTRPNFQLCPTFLTLHCTLTNLNILIVYVLNFTHLGFEVKLSRSFYRPGADLPFLGLDPGDAVGGLTAQVHNARSTRCRTSGYLPICRAEPPIGRCQIYAWWPEHKGANSGVPKEYKMMYTSKYNVIHCTSNGQDSKCDRLFCSVP